MCSSERVHSRQPTAGGQGTVTRAARSKRHTSVAWHTLRVVSRHRSGAEGYAYVRSYLEANGAFGKLLGPLLLAARDIDRGVVWGVRPGRASDRATDPPDGLRGCLHLP